MKIKPRFIQAKNGRLYACFFNSGYAYRWANSQGWDVPQMAVRIGTMAGFVIRDNGQCLPILDETKNNIRYI